MRNQLERTRRVIAKASFLLFAGTGFGLLHSAQTQNYTVSAACGRNYEPNVIQIDGFVNTPLAPILFTL
jgi:hypothetical protein